MNRISPETIAAAFRPRGHRPGDQYPRDAESVGSAPRSQADGAHDDPATGFPKSPTAVSQADGWA
jgi:hypothetical protein